MLNSYVNLLKKITISSLFITHSRGGRQSGFGEYFIENYECSPGKDYSMNDPLCKGKHLDCGGSIWEEDVESQVVCTVHLLPT